MRILLALFLLFGMSACAPDKYSSVPAPKGKWQPANAEPRDGNDNNILPAWAEESS